jgi:outer membrane protein assembly factor BamB
MRDLVVVGLCGCAVAIDRATGSEVWRTELKGSDFVNVVLDGGDVFAGTKGRLFCLDAATGTVRWQNDLKGLGWGLVSIAGDNVAPPAESLRRQRAAAAAAASAAG